MQVLAIEYERTIATLVDVVLEDAGWAVTVRPPTSPELLRIAVEQLDPDCGLLDRSGRGDYGQSWGDAAWLRERASPIPVIMFTVDARAVREARACISERRQ